MGVLVRRKALLDRPAHAARRDLVFLIIRQLLLPTVLRNRQEFLDALCFDIRIQNDFPVEVARRPARRLDQAGLAAQESFFVDRKSTRLNSSHMSISYAVFCLKKK